MRWEGNRESDNVEDARGGGGGGGGFGFGGRSIGIGTIVIALVGGAIFGINPLTILGILSGGGAATAQAQQGPAKAPPADDRMAQVRVHGAGRHRGRLEAAVRPGRRQPTRSPGWCCSAAPCATACGTGQSAMGPFYCPADQKVYIDLNFYETLKTRLGAPGDFAQAYVIAHEVGHHVQNQLGITGQVERLRGQRQPGPVQRDERAAWNCRPTASPASGPTTPRTPARSWSRATSRRP